MGYAALLVIFFTIMYGNALHTVLTRHGRFRPAGDREIGDGYGKVFKTMCEPVSLPI